MNETYRKAKEYIEEVRKENESKAALFIRPSGQGKSHTAYIISRDFNGTIIPPMSTSEQKNWFGQHLNNQIFVFDDPSDWFNEKDCLHVFSVIKNLLSGTLKASRATMFSINVPQLLEKSICFLMFSNEDQFNAIRKSLEKTGLLPRLDIFLSDQGDEQTKEIKKIYKEKKYSIRNLPSFENGENTFDEKYLSSFFTKIYFRETIKFTDVKK